jgi:DNA-directed RNA polymerase omega subunit
MRKIPEKIDSKYRYVLLASQRAEQLVNGAAARSEGKSPKPTRVGMREISDEIIDWDYGPGEEPEEELAEGEVEAEPAEAAEG